LNYECLNINREDVHKKIIGYKKITKLRTFGQCLYKLKCSLENVVKNSEISDEMREEEFQIEIFYGTEKKTL